jgi:hypothetical protein
LWTAAESGDLAAALIPAVWTFLGIVVVTLGTIAVQAQKSRSERPPLPGAGGDHELYERTAVLRQRADDADERDEVQDRRLDQIERHLDLDNPNWRHDGR